MEVSSLESADAIVDVSKVLASKVEPVGASVVPMLVLAVVN